MSRGVVPALVAAGGLGVQVGVNTNSAPPAVPGVLETATIGAPARVFRWRDEASGTEILSSWHAGGYGGHGGQNIYAKTEAGNCIVVDGFEEALCQSCESHTDASVLATSQHTPLTHGCASFCDRDG